MQFVDRVELRPHEDASFFSVLNVVAGCVHGKQFDGSGSGEVDPGNAGSDRGNS
jgi:hypothetical protein